MSVAAHTQAKGASYKYEDLPYTYSAIDYGGYHYYDRQYYTGWYSAWCNNPPVTKTHVVDVGGLPWRMPTRYSRGIQRYNIKPSDVVEYYSGFYTLSKGYPGDYAKTGGLARYPMTDSLHFAYQDNARNRSEVQCLNKLQDQKIDMLTYLAEARLAAVQLAKTSSVLFSALLDLKHGRKPRGNVVHVLKGLRDGYLGYEYGWKPLCSDLKSLYDVFQNGITKPLISRAVSEVTQEWSSTDFSAGYYADCDFKATISNKTILYGKLDNEFVSKASAMNLVNPLQLAWEVVPYSFLVDWAMPIGNVLQAITAPAGMSFISGTHTQRSEARSSGTEVLGPGNSGPRIESALFWIERDVYSFWPIPKLYAKNPLSTKHATNALALWSQLLL